ncbi:hypothetical protein Afil01_04380 [Actinorhabdospora filicis]|uniref:Uncharacterized protein n=1 Tax=Actinorhabdospora filicis TaxID=1785913 RepID=A0A9W6SHL5_9ACTN|nr:hypothetical protein Afil01_04380 [Actinorhabdospora filicis]
MTGRESWSAGESLPGRFVSVRLGGRGAAPTERRSVDGAARLTGRRRRVDGAAPMGAKAVRGVVLYGVLCTGLTVDALRCTASTMSGRFCSPHGMGAMGQAATAVHGAAP